MTISDQRHVCTRPFEWFEIHPDGSVFLCCPAWLKRPAGNLLAQPVAEIWNGPVAQEVRKSILNGSFHNCSRKTCPNLSESRGPVQLPAQIKDQSVREAILRRRSRLDFPPRHLNLCFDHSCTLACPSCREKIRQAGGKELERVQQVNRVVREELLPWAHSVTLSGFGDPFGSPTYLNLLRELNITDFPLLREVRLHSNGLLLNPRQWDSLSGLQPLVSELEISIDASTEPTYRQNRPGGCFATLLENLDFLSQLPFRRILSMVVQQNNWREIPQLLDLAKRYHARVYLSQLVNWGTFDREDYLRRAVHLPGHAEHQAFKSALATLPREVPVNLGNLAGLLN